MEEIHFMAVVQHLHMPQLRGAAMMVLSLDRMVVVFRGEVNTVRSVDTMKAALHGDIPRAVTPAWEHLTAVSVAEVSTAAVAASTVGEGVDNVISGGDHTF